VFTDVPEECPAFTFSLGVFKYLNPHHQSVLSDVKNINNIHNFPCKNIKLGYTKILASFKCLAKTEYLWLVVWGCHGCKSCEWYSRITVHKKDKITYTL
jgi:hypothetical protein